MTEGLEITKEREEPRVVLLRLSGTLDAGGAGALEANARGTLESNRHLALDLSRISFVSSTGIGVLLALNEDFRALGLSLRLIAPSRAVLAPMELLCVDPFVQIYDSHADACTDLAA